MGDAKHASIKVFQRTNERYSLQLASCVDREVEPGSRSCLAAESFPTVVSEDTVTLFPTTVERASCMVHKLLCTGELRPP